MSYKSITRYKSITFNTSSGTFGVKHCSKDAPCSLFQMGPYTKTPELSEMGCIQVCPSLTHHLDLTLVVMKLKAEADNPCLNLDYSGYHKN